MELALMGQLHCSQESYYRLIDAKTASLFGAACGMSAIIAGLAKADQSAWAGYGRGLGLCFQLVDDVMDYQGQEEATGKIIGNDFREGKMTLPLILAIDRANQAEQQFWQKILAHDFQRTSEIFQEALSYVHKYGLIEEIRGIAAKEADKAIQAISALQWKNEPASQRAGRIRELLPALVQALVTRQG